MRASAILEPQARGGPGLLRALARYGETHDHLLAFLDLALRHLSVGSVADAQLQLDRGRLAVGADDPPAPRRCPAGPAGTTTGRPRRALALGGLDPGRAEAQRRVRDLPHVLLLLDHDAHLGGHS